VFHGPLADRIALTEILLSPGGEKLSREAARVCAVLMSMPDPKAQSAIEFEIEKALREYQNPRGLPESWVKSYLSRAKPQLALDVMRAFDAHWQYRRGNGLKLWILSGLVAAQWAVIIALGEFVLQHLVR
jgi:hypothetical protein